MYSETSLLWTFLDPEFLATFCYNVEVYTQTQTHTPQVLHHDFDVIELMNQGFQLSSSAQYTPIMCTPLENAGKL